MNALTLATHGRIGYAIEYDTYVAAGGGGAGLQKQIAPIITVGSIKIVKKKRHQDGEITIKSLRIL